MVAPSIPALLIGPADDAEAKSRETAPALFLGRERGKHLLEARLFYHLFHLQELLQELVDL
jgi:hypothetical protein